MTSGTLVTLAPAADRPDRLAATARDCQAVGAAVVVLPPMAAAATREAVAALREETDLLVQAADPDAGADLVTLCLAAPAGLLAEQHAELAGRGAVPVYAAGTLADLAALTGLLERHGPPAVGPVHVGLVLGGPGGLPGSLPAVAACLERLPAGAVWSAAGRNGGALPVLLAALAAGGHVRAGAADTAAADDPARADLQLVARAAGLARIAQRPPLSPGAARALLTGPRDPDPCVRPPSPVEAPL